MNTEQKRSYIDPPLTFPRKSKFILEGRTGVVQLYNRNDPFGPGTYECDLPGKWEDYTITRKVIRTRTVEDDMNFPQRFVSRFRTKWNFLMTAYRGR